MKSRIIYRSNTLIHDDDDFGNTCLGVYHNDILGQRYARGPLNFFEITYENVII